MPESVGEAPVDPRPDDLLLGLVLISTWALRTGRILRRDVPLGELTAAELIAFWADPLLDEPCSVPYREGGESATTWYGAPAVIWPERSRSPAAAE